MSLDADYLKQALELAYHNVNEGGRPFAAVIVQNDQVIASAVNEMHLTQDPTAHAELLAIRRASQVISLQDLKKCVVYATGQPCPMCLALIHMTGIHKVVYAYSNHDAEAYGLSTAPIYTQIQKPLAEQAIELHYLPVRLEKRDELYWLWTSHK